MRHTDWHLLAQAARFLLRAGIRLTWREVGPVVVHARAVAPSSSVRGSGVFISLRDAKWPTVAHELGHLLGLPHCPDLRAEGSGYPREFMHDGTLLDEYCFHPFAPDAYLDEGDRVTNFMNHAFNNPVDPDDPWWVAITPNQVRRMRLTMYSGVSRWAAAANINEAAYSGYAPRSVWLLNDLASTVARGLS